MTAASILRSARSTARLTQRELAHRARMPQATVGRIEAGLITPRVDTLEHLLRATGQELSAGPRPGAGIDRSQIRRLLQLSPAQRLELAVGDAAGISLLRARATRI